MAQPVPNRKPGARTSRPPAYPWPFFLISLRNKKYEWPEFFRAGKTKHRGIAPVVVTGVPQVRLWKAKGLQEPGFGFLLRSVYSLVGTRTREDSGFPY